MCKRHGSTAHPQFWDNEATTAMHAETPIDFIAYNPDGTVALLAEAKSRRGTYQSWAAKLRRNMLSHGFLPQSQYFLIATRNYVRLETSRSDTRRSPPAITIDAGEHWRPTLLGLIRHPLISDRGHLSCLSSTGSRTLPGHPTDVRSILLSERYPSPGSFRHCGTPRSK